MGVAMLLWTFLADASAPAMAADYAPIDCSKANLSAERAICGNYTLGQSEARMATLFGIVTSLVAMGQRGDIGDAQRQWIRKRNQCGASIGCIADAYQKRIQALSAAMASIESRGPY